jgi:multicomponent Na+:H+ antiporter subunit C
MNEYIGEITAFIIFFIGAYGLMARRNIVKAIISIGIMETAIILFFLTINYKPQSNPPIGEITGNMADPLPQAMMITAIVIGIGITAVGLIMFIHLYHKYGTTNWEKARRKRREG